MDEEDNTKKQPLWARDQKPKNIQARATVRPIHVEDESELFDAIRRVRNGLLKWLIIIGLVVGAWYVYQYYFSPTPPVEEVKEG